MNMLNVIPEFNTLIDDELKYLTLIITVIKLKPIKSKNKNRLLFFEMYICDNSKPNNHKGKRLKKAENGLGI